MNKISFEQELSNVLEVADLEQRLEMAIYCCDYNPGKRGEDSHSCGSGE